MRKRGLSFILSLTALPLIAAGESTDQKIQWKGKIEIEHGVKIMRNPKDSLFGDLKLELHEDLSIGREDDKNYLFHRIRGIDVDNEGNIFVDDMSNFRIQKYDRKGKYLQTFGRKGQGPGDFQMPMLARIENNSGNILVKDYGENLVILNKQGIYINNIHLGKLIYDFIPNEDETIIAILMTGNMDKKHSLCKINTTGEVLATYIEYPYPIYSKTANGMHMMMTTGYELSLYLSEIDQKSIVYGYSKDYELNVIDKNGTVLYRIKKGEPAPRYTSEELSDFNKTIKRVPFFEIPRDKPYFYGIMVDSEARVYVQRNKASVTIRGYGPTDKEGKEVDVFSKEGYYLYKTTLPPNTCVIKNGFIYAYHLDEEEGLESVRRYRIKNWDEIKTNIKLLSGR